MVSCVDDDTVSEKNVFLLIVLSNPLSNIIVTNYLGRVAVSIFKIIFPLILFPGGVGGIMSTQMGVLII